MADETGEKTEPATDKRMKENREKGKLQKSQDVTGWLAIAGVAVMLPSTIAMASAEATKQIFVVQSVAENPDTNTAVEALGAGLGSIVPTVTMMFVLVVVVIIAGSAIQGGIHVKKFTPKFEQFDVVKGLKRTFGGQALWGGIKALLKTAAVGLALYSVVQGLLPSLMSSGGHSVDTLLNLAAEGTTSLLRTAIIAGLILAAADFLVIMRKNRKQTKMTKKEVKDENKNTDGDPLIKSQRRSRQIAMSRNRMLSSVGDADVVLVNPTTYAVAIKYEPGKSAPKVVAKGAGIIAARIREEAEKTGVPMVKDIPLTRALHKACQLGQEIPTDYYNPVARILTFVAALKARGSAPGVHTLPTTVTHGGHN